MKKYLVLLYSLLLSCTSQVLASENPLEKRLNYKIILPDNPTQTQKLAGEELKAFLNANYTKAIVVNGIKEQLTFFIGASAEAAQYGLVSALPEGCEFGIFRQTNNFLFLGKDDNIDPQKSLRGSAGTLLSVYYFLKKYAGIKFFLPGKKGFALNKNQEIKFRENIDIPEPSFSVRGMYLNASGYTREEMTLFARRQLCAVPNWATPQRRYMMLNWHKRFAQSNPEYFALVKGKRDGKYPNHIPCTSNPAVIKQVAADIVKIFNQNRSIDTIGLFCDGPLHPCQCKKCLNSREYKICNEPDFSEYFFSFVTKVANIVTTYCPNKNLTALTKRGLYCRPSTTIKWNSRVAVDVLTNWGLPVKNFNERVADLKLWKKAGARTLIRGYRYPRYKDYPIINPRYLSKYFKTFVGLTSGTLRSDCYKKYPYAYCALNQYIHGQMLFDASQDVNKLINDFVNFSYPGAEIEMKMFISEMERLWMSGNSSNIIQRTYHYKRLSKALELLEKAKAKLNGNSPLFNNLYSGFKKFSKQSQAYAVKNPLLEISPKFYIPGKIKPPNIDGYVNSTEWQGATTDKLVTPNKYSDFQPTKVYIGNDGKNLCVGIIASENIMNNTKINCHKNGQRSIWQDNCIEIMLVPPAGNKDGTYWQLCINSNGNYTLFEKGKIKHKLKFKAATLKNKNRYEIEIAIPLKQFSSKELNSIWRFNIFRNRVLSNSQETQYSGLRFFGGSHHVLDDYPKLEVICH